MQQVPAVLRTRQKMNIARSEINVRLVSKKLVKALQYKYFYWPFQGGASFVDHFCYWYLCFVFAMLSFLFIADLWSPAGKGLTSSHSCM